MIRVICYPLAILYRLVTSARNLFYDRGLLKSYRSVLPVISVGNIQVGGSGKTPLVRSLVSKLQGMGHRPVVLSRGYGGSIAGPHLVTAKDSAQLVGDEALLHLGNGPVVIARRRVEGAKFIERLALGDVIVLDDGLQHRALFRDLEVVTVNCENQAAVEAFLQGALFPCGRFREDRDRALSRADIVVFNSRNSTPLSGELLDHLTSSLPDRVAHFQSCLKSVWVESIIAKQTLPDNTEVELLCGIANPAGFIETVTKLNLQIAKAHTFPDHHIFTSQEIDRIKQTKLPVICTEKDAVKLQSFAWPMLYVLRFELSVEPEEAFAVRLQRALTEKNAASD